MAQSRVGRISRRRVLQGAALGIGFPMLNLASFRLFADSPAVYSARAVAIVERSLVIDMLAVLKRSNRVFGVIGIWRGDVNGIQFFAFAHDGDAVEGLYAEFSGVLIPRFCSQISASDKRKSCDFRYRLRQ